MAIQQGTQLLGPDNATLTIFTGRTGAAAKAGHDLTIQVTAWKASIDSGEDGATSIEMTVDGGSLRVLEGHGGVQKLGDDDKADIAKTIDGEVLKREQITFRSTSVAPFTDGTGLLVEGELTLHGATHPLAVDVVLDGDGALSAETVITQSDWGMKPYSTLYGALKVADDVRIKLEAKA
jgi:polyisoprenoid-binding protein YceI